MDLVIVGQEGVGVGAGQAAGGGIKIQGVETGTEIEIEVEIMSMEVVASFKRRTLMRGEIMTISRSVNISHLYQRMLICESTGIRRLL